MHRGAVESLGKRMVPPAACQVGGAARHGAARPARRSQVGGAPLPPLPLPPPSRLLHLLVQQGQLGVLRHAAGQLAVAAALAREAALGARLQPLGLRSGRGRQGGQGPAAWSGWPLLSAHLPASPPGRLPQPCWHPSPRPPQRWPARARCQSAWCGRIGWPPPAPPRCRTPTAAAGGGGDWEAQPAPAGSAPPSAKQRATGIRQSTRTLSRPTPHPRPTFSLLHSKSQTRTCSGGGGQRG